MSLCSPVASMLAIIASFVLLWQVLVQLSGKGGTERHYQRQLPALVLPTGLRFGSGSPSCLQVLLFLCVNDAQCDLDTSKAAKGLSWCCLFPSHASAPHICFVLSHLLEEVDSAAVVFLSLLTSLCCVTTRFHEELDESWGNSG